MAWWKRKAASPMATKSASFMVALGPGRAGLTGAGYDKLAKEGYADALVAFSCINLIAATCASVEPTLYEETKSGKLKKVEGRHDLTKLLRNPNPVQSGREFIQYLVSYHRLCGNAYVYGNGIDPTRVTGKPPTELQLLDPGKVQIKPGPSYFPLFYEYNPTPNDTKRFDVDQITGKSPVLHIKTFNPLNALYGMSALSPAAYAVDIHTGGQSWNKRLLDNGARPSGALVVKAKDNQPATLTDEQYARVKEMIDSQFSGQENAGRPMLLEGGLEWTEMSISPKDMDFIEGKHSAARDIALSFGVPPMLLGIPGDNTYSNMQEAKLPFWTDTVLPLLGNVLDCFNRWLTPLYGENLYLWYDEETIPSLEPLRKAKADRVNAATYMTLDEKRQAMGLDNYEPDGTPGGTILVPSTQIPLEMAADPMEPEEDEPDEEAEPKVEKQRQWLEKQGYTPERALRLAKLTYA